MGRLTGGVERWQVHGRASGRGTGKAPGKLVALGLSLGLDRAPAANVL